MANLRRCVRQRVAAGALVLLTASLLLLGAMSPLAGAAPQAGPAGSAPAQSGLGYDPRFTRITTEQGLSDLRVTSVVQDDRGFVWFGTLNGLNRYDGYEVVVYRHDPANPHSLTGNFIDALYKDRSGTLWVGTRSGLNAFDQRSERFTRYVNDPADAGSLSNNLVLSILEDREGALWVGTRGGLNRLDRASGTFTRYVNDPEDAGSLSNNLVLSILEDRVGALWAGTVGGLNRFDRASGTFTVYRHDPASPQGLSNDTIWDIFEDHAGALWVATDGGGLNRLDRASETFTHYRHDPDDPASISSDRLDSLFEDGSHRLWVGTFNGGLSVLDPQRRAFTTYRREGGNPTSLSEDGIGDIVADRSGLIWLATGGGVSLHDPRPQAFALFSPAPTSAIRLPSERVDAILEDRSGTLWVGTQDQGLSRVDLASGQVTSYPPDPDNPQGLGHPYVRALAQDRSGALWVGTYGGGLYRLDPESGAFTAYRKGADGPRSLSDDTITDLHVDRTGALWIATGFGGLNRLDPASGSITVYRSDPDDPESLSSDILRAIAEGQDGTIWVGTQGGGLNRLDPATGLFTHYRHDPANPDSLGDDNVFALHFDDAGELWVGLASMGLDRLNPAGGTFTLYNEADGLASDRVISILEGGPRGDGVAGDLWIATGRGLARLDQDRSTFSSYSSTDGLPLAELNPGHYTTRSGRMLLGSARGLIAFDPRAVQGDTYVPPIVFTGFGLANQPVPVGGDSPLRQAIDQSDRIVLSYDDRVITFEVAALSFRAPRQNRYRYRLEGFDQGWTEVDASRRQVTYTNLNPGTYTFRVTGSNGSGVWNETGRAITLVITPPWWQTWWFRALALATVAGGAYGIYALRVRSLQGQRRALEATVAERTRELSLRGAELERAEAGARRSRDELATVLAVSQHIVGTLERDRLLDCILEELERIEQFDGAAIFMLEGEHLVVRAFRSALITRKLTGVRFEVDRVERFRTLIATRRPQILADRSLADDRSYTELLVGDTRLLRAWMGIPLIAHDRIVGILNLYHHEVGYYGPEAEGRVLLFANLAALAIENAQLYGASREAATLEERHRLAHDLHDAVTQSLFSASLVAEALPDDPQRAAEKYQRGRKELRLLTRGALAEMRTLLLELRPLGLSEKPLAQLLRSLCATFTSRTRIPVDLKITCEELLPSQVQEMLYRIVQEALNNVSKHAEASAVQVALAGSQGQVVLTVADDGRGFDPRDRAMESIGSSMRERAEKIGAALRIDSQPGAGTTVTVVWQS